MGYLGADPRPRVYCEVWKPEQAESLTVIAHCQDALLAGWERARALLAD
jgi:hypothetical protein